jgi:multisubunit Na+/H+ antiporter MnhE subunit
MAAMEVAYRVSADLISRSHTVYPGALTIDADPNDPRYTIKFDEDLYKY